MNVVCFILPSVALSRLLMSRVFPATTMPSDSAQASKQGGTTHQVPRVIDITDFNDDEAEFEEENDQIVLSTFSGPVVQIIPQPVRRRAVSMKDPSKVKAPASVCSASLSKAPPRTRLPTAVRQAYAKQLVEHQERYFPVTYSSKKAVERGYPPARDH